MKVKGKTIIRILLVLLLAGALIATDRYAAGMKDTRIREYGNIPNKMLKRPVGALLILGSSTSFWLEWKDFRQATGLNKKQVIGAIAVGGHADANLATVWAAKASGKKLHYKTCLVGTNHYQQAPMYYNYRSAQHRYQTPGNKTRDLFSLYLTDDYSLDLMGNYLACLASNVYCDNGSFRRKVENKLFSIVPENRKYPWWEDRALKQYHENQKAPWRSDKPLPKADQLVTCGALWKDTAYKRDAMERLLDELEPICEETVIVLHATPKACFSNEVARENHLIDRYFEALTNVPHRHLINLGRKLGQLKYFKDDRHLNNRGIRAYSNKLAAELRPILKRSGIKLKAPVKNIKKKK